MELVKEGFDLLLSNTFRNVTAVIGSLVALRYSLKYLFIACKWLRGYILAPWGIGRTNIKNYGPWAVVTGASEGIGRGYSLELARQGLNVVLMSRSRQKLDKVADEIREKYSRDVCVVPVDFSGGAEIYPQLAEKLQHLDIGILVNNVGVNLEYPEYFLDSSIDRQRKIIEVNIQATVAITHYFMPKMVAKNRGIIINLSSVAATTPLPNLMSVYAASKAFVEFFTASLSLEYANKGIIIQSVAPSFVATAMSGLQKESLTVPGPIQYARSALATVGIMDFTHGYLPHALQVATFQVMPPFILYPSVRKFAKDFKDRYLKKQAKEK